MKRLQGKNLIYLIWAYWNMLTFCPLIEKPIKKVDMNNKNLGGFISYVAVKAFKLDEFPKENTERCEKKTRCWWYSKLKDILIWILHKMSERQCQRNKRRIRKEQGETWIKEILFKVNKQKLLDNVLFFFRKKKRKASIYLAA